MYIIQHCFTCHPSDSVPLYCRMLHGIEPRTVATLALTARRSKPLVQISASNLGFQVGGTLIIREALVEDSGKYLCMVNNSVGGESVETVLTVTGAYYHQLSSPWFWIRIALMRIRIHLFTSVRIRIQLFSLQC